MNIEVNILAILIAAFSSMFIGYIWYGSDTFGFGKKWAALTKIDIKKSSTPLALISAGISALVLAFGLAVMAYVWQSYSNESYLASALTVGLFVWLFFQALRMFQRARFNQEPVQATWIHLANEFVTVMVASLIIGLFGV
ncbi:MAG: DUF1761 domain-containing protein [Patescibacteria group bacterium]